jgi:hypothetical protein
VAVHLTSPLAQSRPSKTFSAELDAVHSGLPDWVCQTNGSDPLSVVAGRSGLNARVAALSKLV